MIVPKPSKHWAHMSLPLASYGREATTHVSDLVLMLGDDRLEEIDLGLQALAPSSQAGHDARCSPNPMFQYFAYFPGKLMLGSALQNERNLNKKGQITQ